MVTERPELKIIEPEEYDAVKRILASRGQTFKLDKVRHSNKFLFSTLIKCKECGWSFRRVERTYKNTYVTWVCSGRNGKGADSCANKTSIPEGELIKALNGYFSEILANQKNVIKYVVFEFEKVYRAKDDNVNREKELNAELTKLTKSRQKFMDMYTDDLISREELNRQLAGVKQRIEFIEKELKLINYHLTKYDQLTGILNKTFRSIEDIVDVSQMTNAQLRTIIQRIEVDEDGNVDIYLRLTEGLGIDCSVAITDELKIDEIAPEPEIVQNYDYRTIGSFTFRNERIERPGCSPHNVAAGFVIGWIFNGYIRAVYKRTHKTFHNIVAGIVVLSRKILFENMRHNVINARYHLIFRQRESKFGVHDREFRKNFFVENVSDFEFLLVIGNDRAAVHFAARADHSQNAVDGDYIAGYVLKTDKILIPSVVVTVYRNRYCFRIVANRAASDGKYQIGFRRFCALDSLIEFIGCRIRHNAAVFKNFLPLDLRMAITLS